MVYARKSDANGYFENKKSTCYLGQRIPRCFIVVATAATKTTQSEQECTKQREVEDKILDQR
jgi:hypothetical protein